MLKLLLFYIGSSFASCLLAQDSLKKSVPVSFLRYTDFHIHPTYKHYFRYKTADEMKRILKFCRYDKEKDTIICDDTVMKEFKKVNWGKYTASKKRQKKDRIEGNASDLRNYDQSGYPEIIYVPGSVFCNSYSPYEKQFALNELKRQISSKLVTKMGIKRLRFYSEDNHTPFNDFLAEYYYNYMQIRDTQIITESPYYLYRNNGKEGLPVTRTYRSWIKMVKDCSDLKLCLNHNDRVFTKWEQGQLSKIDTIYTPMVMSIEGAQVLYDTLSGKKENILNPFIRSIKSRQVRRSLKGGRDSLADSIYTELKNSSYNELKRKGDPSAEIIYNKLENTSYNKLKRKKDPFADSIYNDLKDSIYNELKRRGDPFADSVYNELLKSVNSLRNLPHRLFFITLGHFAQNHVVGFAKTLDRDPESVVHRALAVLTEMPGINRNILRKDYEGFNTGCDPADTSCYPDSIGFKVVEAFLNPDSSKFKKPTYIDVKHMDVVARIQYYALRRELEKRYKVPIPIIASHFAVSGENQILAVATGRLKRKKSNKLIWRKSQFFDRYAEIRNPEKFYRKQIVNNKKWKNSFLNPPGQRWQNSPNADQFKFDSVLYKQSPVLNEPVGTYDQKAISREVRKDTIKIDTNEIKIDTAKAGWYYPWSINLFDEEIVEINKSDGIIGLLLDPRQLGAFMRKYRHIKRNFGNAFEHFKKDIHKDSLSPYGLTLPEIDQIEYFKAEPLIRNIFYIVDIINQEKAAVKLYQESGGDLNAVHARYPAFTPDTDTLRKEPWDMISIGGDFDGLIDPIDFSPYSILHPINESPTDCLCLPVCPDTSR